MEGSGWCFSRLAGPGDRGGVPSLAAGPGCPDPTGKSNNSANPQRHHQQMLTEEEEEEEGEICGSFCRWAPSWGFVATFMYIFCLCPPPRVPVPHSAQICLFFRSSSVLLIRQFKKKYGEVFGRSHFFLTKRRFIYNWILLTEKYLSPFRQSCQNFLCCLPLFATCKK